MMMGLEFFSDSVECARACVTPEKNLTFSIQTNATLIDERFCDFFRENGFLVGLSLDKRGIQRPNYLTYLIDMQDE